LSAFIKDHPADQHNKLDKDRNKKKRPKESNIRLFNSADDISPVDLN